MCNLDTWAEILDSLQRHKLRSLLTAFGVFWGIFMLVLLLGAGRGLEKGALSNFGDMAKNTVFFWGGRTQMPYKGLNPGRYIQFTNADIDAVRAAVPEAMRISAQIDIGEQNMAYDTQKGRFNLTGLMPDASYFYPLEIEGRLMNALDMTHKRKIAIIGSQVKEMLFGDEDPIGKYMYVEGIAFQVVGIFNIRNPEDQDALKTIYVPLTTMQQAFHFGENFYFFMVLADPTVAGDVVEEKVKTVLQRRHSVHPDDRQAIGSWNMGREFGQLQALFRGINVFIWLVGAGTIVAGIVGVSNIMLILVKERTKEIGIRKALGATPASIISLILQESVMLTAVSGYLGLVASVGLIEGISYAMDKFHLQSDYFSNPEIDFRTAIIATILLVVTGAIAGYIPARQAANINPIEALRSE